MTPKATTSNDMFSGSIGGNVDNGEGPKFMETQQSVPDAAQLHQADQATRGAAFANTVVWAWKDISVVLVPIVGKGGVAALYNRSLHLTSKSFPWLSAPPTGVTPPTGDDAAFDLEALHGLLAAQGGAVAAAGGEACLRTFRNLLSTLIGVSLTERLLLPVWEKYLNAPSAQDPSP